MREILFRGIATDGLLKGKWVFGFYVIGFWHGNGSEHGIMPTLDKELGGYYEVIPETVGQYTGLKDKNGKRIFEGDIVCIRERGHEANGEIVFVNNYPGGWLITDKNRESKCSLAMRTDVEVIGNIFVKEMTGGDDGSDMQ